MNADPRHLGFALGPYGKPELQGEDALRFSLSHSDALALCAVTRERAVGVDLERIRARIDEVEIAERYFSLREVEQLRAVAPQLRRAAFFRCWTRKEAYIKARGEGLSHPLAQFSVSFGEQDPPALFGPEPDGIPLPGWRLMSLEPGPGYAGAVVAAGTDWTLRLWDAPPRWRSRVPLRCILGRPKTKLIRVPIAPHVAFERALRIAREQWLDPEELQRRQWSRFQRILGYAYQHSPFYARKFRAAGIEPADIQQRSDLGRIPVVTREELRQPEALVPPPFRPETMRHTFSSGSTGESVKSYFDPEGWLVGKHLLKLRARWACGVRPWDRVALFTASAFSNSALRRRVLRQRSFSVHQPPDEILPELLRFAPTVLYGFPSHFKELAEVWPSRLRPKIIFTSGEMLENAVRARIESAFSAPVCDVYGSTELKEIAWECRERAGYHINSDWVLVEIEEPQGSVLVTSLYNRGMPLIRYRLGDTGSFIASRCRCGRSLPLMAVGFCRSVDLFVLPAGGRVSPYTLINAIEVLDEIRQFQIVQESIDRVVVVVVPRGEFTSEAAARVGATLRPHLPGIAIEIQIVASIAREPGGKYRMAMSRVERRTP